MRGIKPSRKVHFSLEESAEVARLARIYEDARARRDVDALAKTADEIGNYLMALFGPFEGEA